MSTVSVVKSNLSSRNQCLYLLAGVLLSATASAAGAIEPGSTISLRGHVGKTDARMLSRKTLWHFGASYLFNMTPSRSLGFTYIGGATNKGIYGPDSSLVYRAYGVVAEGRLPLSQRNNLYLRLSGLIYDHEHENFTGKAGATGASTQQDGVGFGTAVGWLMRFNSGVGLELGYEYLRLGADIDSHTGSFGVSYSF